MPAKVSNWQRAAWVVGFIVAATSVGLIPKLTDLQTVSAAERDHAVLSEDIERVRTEYREQQREIMDTLRVILQKME